MVMVNVSLCTLTQGFLLIASILYVFFSFLFKNLNIPFFFMWVLLSFGLLSLNLILLLGETRFWLRCWTHHWCTILCISTCAFLKRLNCVVSTSWLLSIGVKDKDNPYLFNLYRYVTGGKGIWRMSQKCCYGWNIMDSKYSITFILGNRLTTTVPLSVWMLKTKIMTKNTPKHI